MTKLEQAARQALGALEVATTPLAKDRQEVLRAITTLREALSEVQALSAAPAEQEEAAQRLRKTLDIDPGDVNDPLNPRYIAGFKSGHAAGRRRAAPAASPTPPAEQQAATKAAPAEPPAPRGVPVAWLNPWRADQVTTDYDAYGKHGIPLYTAPQQEAREPSRAAKTWCSYVAGIIGCYLNEPDESTKVQAIAGIIERRLWALPTPQPAPDCHHRPPCDECAAIAAQGGK